MNQYDKIVLLLDVSSCMTLVLYQRKKRKGRQCVSVICPLARISVLKVIVNSPKDEANISFEKRKGETEYGDFG